MVSCSIGAMDALEQLIREERRELVELHDELSKLQISVAAKEAKVAALEEAANLRPTSKAKPRRGGKPKGAISAPWKNTLKALYITPGGPWSYAQIKACYDYTNNQDLALPSVRDRVRALIDSGLIVGDPDEGFCVTSAAAKKFNFPEPETTVPVGTQSFPQPTAGNAAPSGGGIFNDDLNDAPF